MGARKIVVTAIGQIGCIPYELARLSGNGSRCNEEINSAIALFNTGLKRLVAGANQGQLPRAKVVYLDSYKSSQDLVMNARTYGIHILSLTNKKQSIKIVFTILYIPWHRI